MKRILKNTWACLTEKERRQFTVLSLSDVMISILDILSLALLLWVIRFYIQPQPAPAFLPHWLADRQSAALIAVFFLIFLTKNLAAYAVSKSQFRFAGRVAVRLSENHLIHYQESDYTEYVKLDSSVHVRRIAFQPLEFCQYLLTGIQQIITQTTLIVLAVAAIIWFQTKLFLVLLMVLLPPVLAVFYYIKKRLAAYRKNIRTGNERSFQYLFDALKAYVEGNLYQKNGFFLRRFIRFRKQFSKDLFHSLAVQQLPGRLIEIFAMLGLFILILLATWAPGNTDSLLIIGAFMAAAYKIIPGMVRIINMSGQIRAYEFSISDLQSAKPNTLNTASSHETITSIRFQKLCFGYNGPPVLDGLSFSVCRGSFFGITGKSGRGKTTILHLLLGFLKPDSGEILVNGQIKTPAELKTFWPSVAYVRQQGFLIHDTILKNIILEDGEARADDLRNALEISGLKEVIAGFPEGINQMITENGKNISGGQQQRIALARALYKNADWILLDEPFNELDEGSEEKILKQLQQLTREGKTILMVTHHSKALQYCTQILSLDEA